jgi:hypothetical protein
MISSDAVYSDVCNKIYSLYFRYFLHILFADFMFVDKLFDESPINPSQRIGVHNLYATIRMFVV